MKCGEIDGSPPENCTDIWRRGLIVIALSRISRSEEHTSELQSPCNLVCRLLLATLPTITTSLSLHDALPISTEIFALGELNAIRRRLNAVVTNLARVFDRFDEVRRDRRFTTGELHRHLASRLDRDRVVENLFDLVHAQFVNETDLVRVHEAWVAHHVAAVSKVNGQHCPATVLDGARTVIVQLLVVVGVDVAPWEHLLDVSEKLGVDGHHVFEVAVDRAILDHPDLIVALDDLRFDFTDLLINKVADFSLSADDGFARFDHAVWTKRVGSSGPSERWLALLPGFEQGLIRPFWSE